MTQAVAAPGLEKINSLRDGGFSEDEINQYRDRATKTLNDGGFGQQEINDYWGTRDNDNPPGVKEMVKNNLANSAPKDNTKEPLSFMDSLDAGLQMSVSGLIARGKLPEKTLTGQESTTARLASKGAQMVGDIPAYLGGAAVGAATGIGTGPVGMALLSGGGAFALPTAMRENLMDQYQKGNYKGFGDYIERILPIAADTVKDYITGVGTTAVGLGAGALTSGASSATKAAISIPATTVSMTTIRSALDGHAPHAQDFVDNAILGLGMHGAMEGSYYAREVYSKTGVRPEKMSEDSKSDPTIAQDLAAGKIPKAYEGLVEKPNQNDINPPNNPPPAGTSPLGVLKQQNGEPLKLYHSTLSKEGFSEFSLDKSGTSTDQGNVGRAVYLTPSKNIAELTTKGHGRLIESNVNINNPIEIVRDKDYLSNIEKVAKDIGVTSVPEWSGTKQTNPEFSAEFSQKAMAAGYDGVITRVPNESKDVAEVAVFDPKNATILNQGGGEGKPPIPPEPPSTDGEVNPEKDILRKIKIGGEDPEGKKFSWNDLYTSTVDKLDPIKRAISSMDNGTHDTINNAYNQMRLLAGASGKAQHFIENGTFDFNTFENNGKSLKSILSPVIDNLNSFRAFAASKRAVELESRGIKSGMNLDSANKVIADGEEKYGNTLRDLHSYQDNLLKYLKYSGVLNDGSYSAMKEANKNYVPFYRVMEEGETGFGLGSKSGNPIKRIKGSERNIIDPIESVIRNTHSFIQMADKNAAVKSFYDLAKQQENVADYLEEPPTKVKPIKVTKEEMDKFLKDHGIEGTPNDAMTIFRAMRTPLAKNEVGFFDNGEFKVIKVDPDLAEAFNGIPQKAHGMLFSLLSGPAAAMRYGLVSPEFIVRHLYRNALSASVIGEKESVPFGGYYRGLFSYIGKDEWYQNWLKSGGKVSALSGITRDNIRDQMERLNIESPETNVLNKAWNIARGIPDLLHAAQQSLENINRLGSYKKAMQGLESTKENIIDAGFYARNIAPDPSRIGKSTTLWNSITALFNTEIQHTDQFMQALRDRPIPTLAKGFAYITIPTIVNWYHNHLISQQLEKEDRSEMDAWKEAKPWERDAFSIIQVGGYVMRAAKPFLFGTVFATLPERLLDLAAGEDPHMHGLEHFMNDLWQQAVPNIVPTAIVPPLENITNYSFFRGSPLVPEHLMKQLPEYRYSEYTSELTKSIARLVGTIPYIKDTNLASPLVIDNYLRQWGGSLGSYALQGLDKALRTSGVLPDPPLPANTLADIPFVKAFVVRYPSAQAASIQQFQEEFKKRAEVTTTYQALIKQGELAQANELAQKHPAAFFKLDKINTTLTEQNKVIRMLYKNPDIKPDEKRQLIDSTYYQMIQIAKYGTEIMDAIDEQNKKNQP